jgi:hypothetical protein
MFGLKMIYFTMENMQVITTCPTLRINYCSYENSAATYNTKMPRPEVKLTINMF